MENANNPVTPGEVTDAGNGNSPAASPRNPSGRWAMNTVYGFAGLVMLALVITVVSPDAAVAVSEYLPQQYQETLFAAMGANPKTCSAGTPVASFGGCCPSQGGSCGAGSSCGGAPAGSPEEMDDMLVANLPVLSLDDMLQGVNLAE